VQFKPNRLFSNFDAYSSNPKDENPSKPIDIGQVKAIYHKTTDSSCF
jgi:hypothetical protein